MAEIKKQMYLRNWRTQDLADATGYTRGTIRVMLNNPQEKLSDKALGKICGVLKIKLE